MKVEVTKDDIVELQQNGAQFLDGIHGGFIVGKSHSEGGIKVLTNEGDSFYTGECEFEGGEYLMNPWATELYKERLMEINAYKGELVELRIEDIEKLCKTLPVTHDYSMILISNYPQMIINKVAASFYLQELDDLNTSTLPE